MNIKLFEEFCDDKPKYFSKIGMCADDVFTLLTKVHKGFEHHGSLMSRNYKKPYPGYNNNKFGEPLYPSKEDAYIQVNKILSDLQGDENSDTIKVYRSILVESGDEDDIWHDLIGSCWTYDKQSAIDFGKAHHRANCLLSGDVTSDMVDWESTIQLYFTFTIMQYDRTAENEIRLKADNYKIPNLKIEWI